ncbi:MAG: hypothetical protein JWM71_1991 [Solirubrobacteraceae bacterium]|nr:hypothetical protein [Solirubrobacteraceae bacterium]
MSEPDLDAWLAEPTIRTRHRRTAPVTPDVLWQAAEGVRLRDTRNLGRLVRWRIPGVAPDTTFRDLFRAYPFTVLDEGDGWSVSGLAGRIWTLDRDYPRLEGAEAFRAWDRPGSARVVFAHWVEPDGDTGSALVSEARVEGTNRRAQLRLRALWAVVGRFERLIGGDALSAATRRAAS